MRSVQLYLLLSPRAADEGFNSLPALQRLLGRAGRPRALEDDTDAVLLQAFGVERQRDWPVAPFTCLADGEKPNAAYWLRADPVHLRADRDVLVLMDVRSFELTTPSANALAHALNAHFEADGIRFFTPTPQRWYARLPAPPDLVTSPLLAAAGRSIGPMLPTGGDALAWHRIFNEIQMLFHSHPVNEAREATGEPAINSVWFWGGGILPSAVRRNFAAVWSTNALASGLAQASATPLAPVPDDAHSWLSQASQGDHLVVLEASDSAQAEALRHWDRTWFAPLSQALRKRDLARLVVLMPSNGQTLRFELEPADLWKFWRRDWAAGQ